MYSLKAMEHFLSPRNAGRLEPGQGVGHGEALDPQCCGKCALDVRLVDGRVDESRFVTEGCSGAIAACSALTTLVEGTTRQAAASLDAAAILQAIDGLPDEKHGCARQAIAALRAALDEAGGA
jgi:nitrogen fixation NifU-like protein